MNIPIARVEAANWVFHTSMIAMTIGALLELYTAYRIPAEMEK